MKLTKKLNTALILAVVCLVLTIGASYAWFVMATSPEVNSIETNVGANGSLEIALLTKETFEDPSLITSAVGDSVVEQGVWTSNIAWGNLIHLNSYYGLDKITLLPARLNVKKVEKQEEEQDAAQDQKTVLAVDESMLKIADFGVDGRIKILAEDTVSTIHEGDYFTYHVDAQRYGVRAIGTISNIAPQQTALASARTLLKSYNAAATRTVESAWREYGAGIVDILYRHYALGENKFTEEDAVVVQKFAASVQDAVEYLDKAMRQAFIGIAASYAKEPADFEAMRDYMERDSLDFIVNLIDNNYVDDSLIAPNLDYLAGHLDDLMEIAQNYVANSYTLSYNCTWKNISNSLPLNTAEAYLGDKRLSDPDAFASLTYDNVLLLSEDCYLLGEIANYTGNYSAFTTWKDGISMELQTASDGEPLLPKLELVLDNAKAALGGWTRTNLNDTYGFAIDLAFRCNETSELRLQTDSEMRVEDDSEFPVTGGGGSYMSFLSENMDNEHLLKIMDTLRVGFLNDKNELLGVAKLGNYMQYEVWDEYSGSVEGRLYLYDFTLDESGKIVIGERKEDAAILQLPRNTPVIVTAVVWMDGDNVDNSMVNAIAHQSMYGTLNLQFSSSADLIPSQQIIKNS